MKWSNVAYTCLKRFSVTFRYHEESVEAVEFCLYSAQITSVGELAMLFSRLHLGDMPTAGQEA